MRGFPHKTTAALIVLGCGACISCPSVTRNARTADAIALASRTSANGDVVATWVGRDPGTGSGPDAPVGQWIREIEFRFNADPVPLRYPFDFDPLGSTFDIFSPDGRYAALSLGRGQPFHIVPIASLRAYLKGESTARETVTGQRRPDDRAILLEEPKWTSASTFEVEAVCCGAYWHVTHHVGGDTQLGPMHIVDEARAK